MDLEVAVWFSVSSTSDMANVLHPNLGQTYTFMFFAHYWSQEQKKQFLDEKKKLVLRKTSKKKNSAVHFDRSSDYTFIPGGFLTIARPIVIGTFERFCAQKPWEFLIFPLVTMF